MSEPNQGRHVCPDCGRSYKAVETLNRHRKNHSTSAGYLCPACDASFKRKDLLDRHMHIHDSGHAGSLGHRSQRACVRCSRLKTRCDNCDPCSRCVRGGHDCVYKDNGIRAKAGKSSQLSRMRSSSEADSIADSISPEIDNAIPFSMQNTYDVPEAIPEAGMDWTTDTTWLDNLPQISPLYFNDPSASHANLASASGMLWDISMNVSLSPSDTFVDPQMQQQPQVLGFEAPGADGPQWCPVEQPHTFQATERPANPNSGVQVPLRTSQINFTNQQPHPAAELDNRSPVRTATPTKDQVVAEITKYALHYESYGDLGKDRAAFWENAAHRVEIAFSLENTTPEKGHILQQFAHDFFEKFNIRFPFLWRQGMEIQTTPPYLYIVIAAIGAAFGGSAAVEFHTQTIDTVMMQLVQLSFQHRMSDEKGLSLCQSLALVQASILFFGHRKRFFAFAQQIGTVTVSLARRINIFNEGGPHHLERYLEEKIPATEENKSRSWVDMQLRRRLAMALLRLEVFISILIGTRPLVSFEEVNVHIPLSDAIWLRGDIQDHRPTSRSGNEDEDTLILSDLVRIALDREEPLPSNMQPYQLESVLYGLQHYVWRFSHDPNVGQRLAIEFDDDDVEASADSSTDAIGHDMLDFSKRGMRDLKNDYRRTIYALRKWKAALTASARTDHLMVERKSLLASRLLYDVSFMRLKADLFSLHRLALNTIKDGPLAPSDLISARDWAHSKRASIAVEHACSTWGLITHELRRPKGSRAEFNILSNVALLHSAVVVWAYAGQREDPGDIAMEPFSSTRSTSDLRVYRDNNFALMQSFAKLLKEVQPMRAGVKTAYHHTVATLAERPITVIEEEDV